MNLRLTLTILGLVTLLFSTMSCDNKAKKQSFRGDQQAAVTPQESAKAENAAPAISSEGSGESASTATATDQTLSTLNQICTAAGELNPEILTSLIKYLPTGIAVLKPILLDKVEDPAEKELAESILNLLAEHADDVLMGTNLDEVVSDLANIVIKFKPNISQTALNSIKSGCRLTFETISDMLKKQCDFKDAKQLVGVLVSELIKVVPADLNLKFLSLINEEKINEFLGKILSN